MLLSVIVPCFNEESALPYFYKKIEEIRQEMTIDFEYIFVNDGSTDATLGTIKNLYQMNPTCVNYLSFSRNFGKEAALLAGLQYATGDLITVMDADLQDPPELLPEMYQLLQEKNLDCVGTRRKNRAGEPKIRSFFARVFYRLINHISDTQMVEGARDFRLMTRQMVDAILELQEYNRFSKGIFNWVGFDTEYIDFENKERIAGETSWSFWGLFKYSLEGIINFSEIPLVLASLLGFISCVGSVIGLVIIIVRTLVFGDPTSGWPSLACILLFIGGLQMLCLGIVGKYIGRIFLETKKRPIYIVKEKNKTIEKSKNSHKPN